MGFKLLLRFLRLSDVWFYLMRDCLLFDCYMQSVFVEDSAQNLTFFFLSSILAKQPRIKWRNSLHYLQEAPPLHLS